MEFLTLSDTLKQNPELCSVFDYKAVSTYIEVVNLLKPKLEALTASYQVGPPPTLSVDVHEFLRACFSMSDFMGKLAWESFRKLAWSAPFVSENEKQAAIQKHLTLFLEHGTSWNIGVYNLQPPTRVCVDTRCSDQLHADPTAFRDRELVERKTYPVTIFTRDLGSIPAFATSTYCRKCNTRYYPNYFVQNASLEESTRDYYSAMPQFIQSSQHFYIAVELCELFSTMLVTSFTSATNCAHIYNQGLKNEIIAPFLPADWQTSLNLSVEDVWNAFYLHSLLIDHNDSGSILQLRHHAESQAKRLQPALQARNAKTAGPGQEAWNHACERCCYVYDGEFGEKYQVRSVVTDGITIGRPTCSVHDCTNPLSSVRHHYCGPHHGLSKICAVVKCDQKIEEGFRTCAAEDHRKIELYNYQKGKAMFQLKSRLERSKISHTVDSLSTQPTAQQARFTTDEQDFLAPINNLQPLASEETEDTILEGPGLEDDKELALDLGAVCDGKPESGNRSVRARFSRRWTHNEQLCVASCGVILGRATFYGSEAPNGVRTFWRRLFPTKASLPFVLWHDNNCRVMAMLQNDPEDHPDKNYFDGCALAVDVFHFNCKHKESDEACNRDCNPYKWPVLRTPEGNWRFNSSAAEQANAWFGGFQAIVREMQVDRYEFFLDEMIKRRNRVVIKELKRKGEKPYSIPREELLRAD